MAPRISPAERLLSLDAYRGFIMLAMVSSGFAFASLAKKFPDSQTWQFLGFQFDHVTWGGWAFWDLIQPSFMFMVGVAIPFSHASRLAKGDSRAKIAWHVILRSIILILLGIFLSSNWSKRTDFTFVNVLTQIGLGYTFVYLLHGRGLLVQLLAVAAILGGYWYFFYQYPAPPPDFDYAAVKFPSDKFQPYTGLFAHWNPSNNAAAAFDRWFLNLFPRQDSERFVFNSGGYQTLNFVPSMATMIFGLMAGEMLKRTERSAVTKLVWLLAAAMALTALGWWLDKNYCPSVKRIWTPSWALFSTGLTFAILAGFFTIIDVMHLRGWSLPLAVVGMNSIAVYCMAQLLGPWVRETIQRHIGPQFFQGTWFNHEIFPAYYAPMAEKVTFLIIVWLVAAWMYRQRLFVRI